jgi:cytochrome P450
VPLTYLPQLPTFFPDGPKWKTASKVTHAALRTDAVKQYSATQELYLRQLLISLLDRPQDYYDEIRMYALYLVYSSIALTLYTQGDEPHHGRYHVRDVTRGDGQGGR